MRLGLGIGLTSGGPVAAPFTPADDASITYWLRPQLHVALAGSDVATWTDSKAGAVWTGGSNKPTYNAANAAFLGEPTIHWSASANQNLTSLQPLTQPASYFFIVKCDDQSSVRSLITLDHIIQAGTTGIAVTAGATSVFGPGDLTGGVHTLAVVLNGASTKVYVDGVLQSLVLGTGNPGAANQAAIQIGFTAVSWVGDMADVIMWSGKAISAGDVANMHEWANATYGAGD